MRKYLTYFAAGGLLLAGAYAGLAQVNVVPQSGLGIGYVPKNTFSAVFIGLAPAATTTDLTCIAGSASKVVRVASFKISGSAGTTLSLPVTILRRATADSGGTAASTTANPANTISTRDTGLNPVTSATATLIAYTANPTINDTSPTYLDSFQLAVSLTTMATTSIPAYFDWSKDIENNINPPTLRGTAQQICANLNSTSLASGLLTGSWTWTEE